MANFIVNRCNVTETLNADIHGASYATLFTGDTIVSDVELLFLL
jgi:hypothetical protein